MEVYMLFFTLSLLTASSVLNCPPIEVVASIERVITEYGYDIAYKDETSIYTIVKEVDVNNINKWIIEEFPDENPGWTQARVQIFITLKRTDSQQTEIEINAGFERFGTPSALLLIPPHWRFAQSNGNLEKELMDKIKAFLSTWEEK